MKILRACRDFQLKPALHYFENSQYPFLSTFPRFYYLLFLVVVNEEFGKLNNYVEATLK